MDGAGLVGAYGVDNFTVIAMKCFSLLQSVPGITFLAGVLSFASTLRFVSGGNDFDILSPALTGLWYLIASVLVPLFVIRRSFKNPADYGWRMPENRGEAIRLAFLVTIALLPFAVWFAHLDSFQQYYSVRDVSPGYFVRMGVILSAILYPAEEFLLRGFLFLGIWKKAGYHSFWITAVLATIFHVSKPGGEIMFAPLLSVVLSFLTLKTKSFVPAAVVHYALALVFNIFVTLVWNTNAAQIIFRF